MNKEKGRHFTYEDRREIENLLEKKYSIRRIAVRLGKSPAAVCKEINRNRRSKRSIYGPPGEYKAYDANQKAISRRSLASMRPRKIKKNPELRAYIEKMLLDYQTPAAISGRLASGKVKGLPSISRRTIERYINSGECELLRIELMERKRIAKRRHVDHARKAALQNRTFVEERPKVIMKRKRIGDLEVDFIVSGRNGKGRLLTAVDRRTRKCFIKKLYPVNEKNLTKLLEEIKVEFPELKSITTDNDLLFAKHITLSEVLQIPIYFCRPFHSWEKGSVENLNKFIRKLIPKGTDISRCSVSRIKQIQKIANSRYMEILNFMSPDEFYEKERNKDC